jgi:ArsR family transcriptional regulator, arsenate/arsenite/antimonite-responsive transcriptional repressor
MQEFLRQSSRDRWGWRERPSLGRIRNRMKLEEMTKVSKALADHTRLRILEFIARKEETPCGKLAGIENVAPATVSHHLKILSEAGLIECRREGQFVFNRVKPERVRAYAESLKRLSRGNARK